MNTDAIYAWEYALMTMNICNKEAMKDPAFVELICDLRDTYPEELDVVLDLLTEGGVNGL